MSAAGKVQQLMDILEHAIAEAKGSYDLIVTRQEFLVLEAFAVMTGMNYLQHTSGKTALKFGPYWVRQGAVVEYEDAADFF